MNKEEFAILFNQTFPLGNAEDMADAVFDIMDPEETGQLDFKVILKPFLFVFISDS